MLKRLLRRQILFVGGKGGVGKTTTAAALGLLAAGAGHRCLLVSTDPAHSLGDIFGQRIGDRETALGERLTGLEIDPDAEADRHLSTVKANMRELAAPSMYGEIERQMNLARHAPGATEAAMMERVAELMGDALRRHDRVIFDTAPTGHTLRLLSLPEAMASWTEGLLKHRDRSNRLGEVLKRLGGTRQSGGRDDLSMLGDQSSPADSRDDRIRALLLERRRKFHRARRLLLDKERCAFVWVLIPERLPILESRRAIELLQQFKIPVEGLVVNRILPEDAVGAFLDNRREQERAYLGEIERSFAKLPQWRIPLLPQDIAGLDSLETIAARLGDSAGA